MVMRDASVVWCAIFIGLIVGTTVAGDGSSFKDSLTSYNTDLWGISTYATSDLFASQWETSAVQFNSSTGLTLTITTAGCPGACGGKNYSAGEYVTTRTYTYGYFEATFVPACAPGGISSMFSYLDVARGAEIDIEFEGDSEGCTQVSYTHYANNQTFSWGEKDLGFNASQAAHAYGFLWNSEYITWYVDRKIHFTTKGTNAAVPVNSMYMILNNWVLSEKWAGTFPDRVVNAVYTEAAYYTLDNLPSDLPTQEDSNSGAGSTYDSSWLSHLV
eukprot:TRINITY_DN6476_c0_g2_i1.p1 TRINITY_DN6476_c0_g2~~TRINITY_DN6476_c0_g2_i1.p1  ORF type:complete len:273 (+),score=28.51 TRINITY_DN6476_c0_g2_i1:2-820(+)